MPIEFNNFILASLHQETIPLVIEAGVCVPQFPQSPVHPQDRSLHGAAQKNRAQCFERRSICKPRGDGAVLVGS